MTATVMNNSKTQQRAKKKKPSSSGFGLSAQLGSSVENVCNATEENVGIADIKAIPISSISIENNPRSSIILRQRDIFEGIKEDDPDIQLKKQQLSDLESLSDSIKEKGLLYPIHVYKEGPNFILAMGQRRCLASAIAGKKTIAAKVWEIKPNDFELKVWQNLENTQREDLTPWEKVETAISLSSAYKEVYDKDITASELGKAMYCKKVQGKLYYDLAHNAQEDVIVALKSGKIKSLRNAYEISRINDKSKREELVKKLIENKISREELAKAVSDIGTRTTIAVEKKTLVGKRSSRVTLGKTTNMKVAEEIFTAVISRKNFSSLKCEFSDVDWGDYKSATKAFKKLLHLMEKEISD